MKAIVRRAQIENAIRCWSRHATPVAFTHLCLSGITGRQFYRYVDQDAPGLFVVGRDDWATLPDEFKSPGGEPLHQYAGLTPTTKDDDWNETATIELFVLGHLNRYVNGTRRDGEPFCAMQLDDATFVNAISSLGVVYRSDQGAWANVPDQYKLPDGSPRVDPEAVEETTVVQWSDGEP